MIYSVQQIKYDILAQIKAFGGRYEDWHIGICEHPRKTLFDEHKVSESQDIWIYKQALTIQAAKTVRDFFLKLNVNGRPDYKPTVANYVYAYKKGSTVVDNGSAAKID